MAIRIIMGIVTLLAIVQGLAPDLDTVGIVPIVLVVLGVTYAVMGVDADNPTTVLVVAIAVGAASGAQVLSHIPMVGSYLDAIVASLSMALYASVIGVLTMRIVNHLKG
jgi:hypothetical protein